MKVVDCTIGVRMAPVSLSGLMPWCTSLLVLFSCHGQRTREGKAWMKGMRPKAPGTPPFLYWFACVLLLLPGQGPKKTLQQFCKLNTQHADSGCLDQES